MRIGLTLFWRHAGLITVWAGESWCLHIFPKPPDRYWGSTPVYRHWGRSEVASGRIQLWGLGPLVLIARFTPEAAP